MKPFLYLAASALLLGAPFAARVDAASGKIAFTSNRTGNNEIFVVAPDGTGLTNLTNTTGVDERIPAWSPDGAKLAYQRTDDIWTMAANGSNQLRIPTGHDSREASFKPNSNLISYSRFGGSDQDIYVITPDGATETRIVNNPLGDYYARWNPDGSKLSFYTFNYSQGSYPPDIYVSNPDGSGQVRITTTGGNSNASWSPDGGRIVFQSSRDGNSEIYSMNPDGSNQVRLTTNAATDGWPTYSPDGTQIAFVSDRDGNNEIYIMNADGTNPVRLTNNSADDNNPSWGQTLPAGAPSVSISDSSVTEGNSGSTNASFTLTLSAASTSPVTVTYRTYDGTASAGSDYTAQPFTAVTFAPGTTSKAITVPVSGDNVQESNETFSVRISALGATVAKQVGVGTIVNDDGAPTVSIGNLTLPEGNSSNTTFALPVSLSAASNQNVSVAYATSNGSAVSGSDYVATTGTLIIPAGQTAGTISISVVGDVIKESNETFAVNLSAPVNAILGQSHGVGTINNDDTTPGVSVNNASATEGATLTFTVTLSATSSTSVTMNYATADGTAIGGSDYAASSGTLTIPAGKTSAMLTVATLNDSVIEGTETFSVNLSNVSGGILVTGQGTGTITNDDYPDVYISSVTEREGNGGQRPMYFTISLSEPAPFGVLVTYTTADGTATAGSDYVATSKTVGFATGQLSSSIPIYINADTLTESNENFFVNLSAPVNAKIPAPSGVGVISNDDPLPAVSISDVSLSEGNSGTTIALFTISLSNLSQQNVSVNFATANGTATAGSDYTSTSGTLTIPAGQLTQTLSVVVAGDTVVEGDETFTVSLTSPLNATLKDGVGQATILNDDAAAQGSFRTVSWEGR